MEKQALDEVYESLTDSQKAFIDNHVKRGKKTKWLNILAKKKGMVLSEEALFSDDDVAELEWMLDEIEDAGHVSAALKCVCGKSLRYRYTVRHVETGVVYKLGNEHLEQYTGLEAQTVKNVVTGFRKIDLERDELLEKVALKWRLPFDIPVVVSVPEEIKNQLKEGLPLLDRQLKRLAKLVKDESEKTNQSKLSSRVLAENEEPVRLFDIEAFETLYNKLQHQILTDDECETLYLIFKQHKNTLQSYGYDYKVLQNIPPAILGKYGTTRTRARNLLFDIKDLR